MYGFCAWDHVAHVRTKVSCPLGGMWRGRVAIAHHDSWGRAISLSYPGDGVPTLDVHTSGGGWPTARWPLVINGDQPLPTWHLNNNSAGNGYHMSGTGTGGSGLSWLVVCVPCIGPTGPLGQHMGRGWGVSWLAARAGQGVRLTWCVTPHATLLDIMYAIHFPICLWFGTCCLA